jgi:hypothetical protein
VKPTFVTTIAMTILLGISSAALASGGCGSGYYRGGNGGCYPKFSPGYAPGYAPGYVPNYNPGYGYPGGVVVAPEGVVPGVGVFYPGRGYWNGNGYYLHRRYGRGGWQYW